MKEVKQIFWKYKIQIIFVLCLILIISWFTSHSDLINVAKNSLNIVNGDFSMVGKTDTGEIVYSSFFPPAFHFIDALISYPFVKLGIYNFDLNNIPNGQLLLVGFLLKLRYLILFVISLFLVVGISKNYEKDIKNKRKIFLLWLMCPVLIFIPFSWGNNDIYPVFLLLLFLFFAFKKRYLWAMIFLGLSAATKNFSLFLIPVMALILADKKIGKTIFYGFIGLLVYIIPWFLYREVAGTGIISGGEGLFILQRKIMDGPLLFPLVYFITLLFLITKQKINDLNRNEVLVKYGLLVMSLFYLASFFIPHWFLWIMPFFVLTAYKNKKMFYLYILINITFFIGIFSWSRNIDTNLFSVAFPLFNKITTVGEVLAKFFPDFKIFEIIFTAFYAAFVSYLYLLFFDKEKEMVKDELTNTEINIFSLSPLFIYLAICLVFVFGMVFIRNSKNREWYDLGLFSRNEVLEPVTSSGQFYQTFKSPKNRLKGINLFLSTYSKKVTTPYKLVLYDKTCKSKILETDIVVDKVVDNSYKEIFFNEIKDSKDKEYCFTVEPTLKQVNTPITFHYSKYGSYASGELIINKKKVKNEDVVFQLIYPLK